MKKVLILIILTLTLFSCSAGVSSYNKYDKYYPYQGTRIYDDYIYRARMNGYLPTPYCSPNRTYNNRTTTTRNNNNSTTRRH